MVEASRWRPRRLSVYVVPMILCLATLALAQSASTVPTTGPTTEPATQPISQGPWIIEHLKAGGMTTVVQVIISIIGLGVVIERLVHLRRGAILPARLLRDAQQMVEGRRFDDLEKRLEGDRSILGEVLGAALRHRAGGTAAMSASAGDVASRELRRQSQKCYPIAIVATIEPLLGLFGTVVGMIEAFGVVAVAGAMGNPSILADSISKALITTEVGLAISMPALVIYHYLKGRIGIIGVEMEEAVTDLVDQIGEQQTVGR